MNPQSTGDIIRKALERKNKPRPLIRFLHGDHVTHATYGKGIVIGEWGSMLVKQANGRVLSCSCIGIYDVEFRNSAGEPFLHCTRCENLTKIPTPPKPKEPPKPKDP